jgi:hypothetical protein
MRRHLAGLVLVSLAMLLHGSRVRADIIGTIYENGHGSSLDTVSGARATLTHSNGVDPFDPGSGLKPLIYDLGSTLAVVNGDILVSEPGSTEISDIFRFFTDATTSRKLLIVYSDVSTSTPPKDADLADVGIPSLLQTNTLTLTETGPEGGPNGIFNYTPTPNQPGYVALPMGFGNIVYNLYSDSAVPEPASIALLGVGLAAALGVRKLIRSRP